ncbi:hypothetical protein JGU66_35145 [Myxococcaceae bacterium JPH2]|nr:hypothetical protein [Myxococcaceae bacterium JPH2]
MPTEPASPSVSVSTQLGVSLASAAFLVVAFLLSGGSVGLTVGVVIDKAIDSDPHGLPGLMGLVLGTPTGALLGTVVGLFCLRGRTRHQRVRLGWLALAVGAVCALGMWGSVQLGLMSW